MRLRLLKDLALTSQARVFLRLDLNVPILNGVITDETRIISALPTIRYLLEKGLKITVASHLGRPKTAKEVEFSLEVVGSKLAELLNCEVLFVDDYAENSLAPALDQQKSSQIILLENLRFNPGETKNSQEFARNLVKGFDFYVDDAFGAVHRAHASVCAAAELFQPEARAAGMLIESEVAALDRILEEPAAPFTVVMGGSKVSDKINVILNLIERCNNILIGGAMAYSFLKYKGYSVGRSRTEDDKVQLVKAIFEAAEKRNVNIQLPIDHVCAAEFSETSEATITEGIEIPPGLIGLDIGPKTRDNYARIIGSSGTVLWNGPMGVFEWPSFSKGTFVIANAIADSHAVTVVGGGDSVAALNQSSLAKKITHVSTGGGASLEYLEGKVLPGLLVLSKRD